MALRLDQRRAALVAVVDDHAIQALEAVLVDDLAVGLDRLVVAAMAAGLARRAALGAARDPVEAPQLAEDRQPRAQRAEIAAEALEHERRRQHQRRGPRHEGPRTHEDQRDRRLERLDLDGAIRPRARRRAEGREADDARERDVLDALEPRVQRRAHAQWLDARELRELAHELLQRAERTQPAAERAASPRDERDRDEGPQQHRHRVVQEEAQSAAGHQRLHERGDVDDGQLPLRIPADEHQREHEVGGAKAREPARVRRDPARSREHHREHGEAHAGDGEIPRARPPDAFPRLVVGMRQHDELGRQRHAQREVARDAFGVHDALAAHHVQRHVQRLCGIEPGRADHAEHLRVGAAQVGRQHERVVEVEVAHLDRQLALVQRDAVGDRAADEVVADEGPRAARDREQRMIALVEATLQVRPASLAEQVAAGDRASRGTRPTARRRRRRRRPRLRAARRPCPRTRAPPAHA